MDSAFSYILALVLALIPFGAWVGSYMLYARINRSLAATARIKRHYALRQLGSTTLLIVDMNCIRSNHAAHSLAVARRAGIHICLTTRGAARTIAAARLGYAESPEDITVVHGKEIQNKTGAEIVTLLKGGAVLLSHMSPEEKVHLVTHTQQEGEIVTLATADTEDALPLEYANVGATMGSPTPQTERVTDLVIQDGDITTLIGALQSGRVAISNNRKALNSSLVGSVAAVGVIVISLAGGIIWHVPPAVSVIQILAIVTLAGVLPALLLASDKHEGNPMHHSPNSLAKHTIKHAAGVQIIWSGLIISGLAYSNYLWFFNRNNIDVTYLTAGSTVHNSGIAMALITAAVCLLAYTTQQRSVHGLFARHQRHNRTFWLGTLLAATTLALLPLAPIPTSIGLVLFNGTDWLYIVGSGIVFLAIGEFQRHNRKHHRKAVLELHHEIHAKSLH